MLSENAQKTLDKRYFLKNPAGEVIETTPELFRRVARALAAPDGRYGATPEEVEARSQQFEQLLYNAEHDSPDFLPNSPTLANAGKDGGQLSACFVLPVPDDLGGIFEAIKQQALIHQTGGGTGMSFSRLRPKWDRVRGSQGVSSGPLSFADVFSAATESIKQGGMRRGANMGILRVDHPDIMDFIGYKEDLTKLTNFNISVAVTDAFMEALKAGDSYALINPRDGSQWGTLPARRVFDAIVQRAWSTGEPGVVFIDRMNRYCPVPWLGEYEATNPCGEQPLLPYESCNLGSINLENFVIDSDLAVFDLDGVERHSDAKMIDWFRLRACVRTGFRMLNNVVDANSFPVAELKTMSDLTRKIGLGAMGYARMLYKLGVEYGSADGLLLAQELMMVIDIECKFESVRLAMSRGPAPCYEGNEDMGEAFWLNVLSERAAAAVTSGGRADYELLRHQVLATGFHNSNHTTIAPTGTLSIIADTSGGCEPVFGLVMIRKQADMVMYDTDKVFRAKLAELFDEDVLLRVLDGVGHSFGSLRLFLSSERAEWLTPLERELLDGLAAVFVVAHDITPEAHVLTQAAFQKFNDSSISKTINFPEWATTADVEKAIMLAWHTDCKGITLYRNNCRTNQPLNVQGDAPVVAPQPEKPKVCPTCGACNPCGDACSCPAPVS